MRYADFWPRYLHAHSRAATRGLHYVGSILSLVAIAAGVVALNWHWVVAAPLFGYGFAWAAHLAIEHNRPETFRHPLWSLASDYRMLLLWATGRLGPELARAGVHEGHVEAA